MRKILLILMLGIFLVSLASAESILPAKVGEDKEIYQVCNNCTYCNFTSVKINRLEILNDVETTKRGTYYFYTIDKGNITTSGTGEYCYDCGNSVDVLTGCIEFPINNTGESFDLIQGFMLLGQLTMIGLFVTLGLTFSKDRWKLKSFFFMMATGMGVILLNSTRIIAAQSGALNSMGNVGLYIGIITLMFMTSILLIYFTIDIIDSLKQKKARKWV